ncbi:MAG: hypothetical protein HOQ05_04810 [Corynebacteriales bacterium]|nr:hypothetical protein [Mycobacteriales bacterium]
MDSTPAQIRAALPERWHKQYDTSISGLIGSPLEMTLYFWAVQAKNLAAFGPVTQQQHHTGELLRQRDVILQHNAEGRDAVRLDGEATGGYPIRFTDPAQEQMRHLKLAEEDLRHYIADKLPDPHGGFSVVRPGAKTNDFRETLLYKWAIAYIAGNDGKQAPILVTAVS